MKKMKFAVAVAALLGSSAAYAGASANIGVVSEYLFRGLPQSGGAAVQGGLDYEAASGFYAGTWGSTINFAGATGSAAEVDLYAGFSGEAGSIGYDVGAIYYWYSEEKEGGANPDPSNNTFEIYGSLSFGPATLGLNYSLDDYFAITKEAVMYPYLDLSFPVGKKLSLDLHVGQQTFDDDTIAAGTIGSEDIMDYSIGLSTELENGVSAGFAFVGTDSDTVGWDDDMKFVISGGYSFDI